MNPEIDKESTESKVSSFLSELIDQNINYDPNASKNLELLQSHHYSSTSLISTIKNKQISFTNFSSELTFFLGVGSNTFVKSKATLSKNFLKVETGQGNELKIAVDDV